MAELVTPRAKEGHVLPVDVPVRRDRVSPASVYWPTTTMRPPSSRAQSSRTAADSSGLDHQVGPRPRLVEGPATALRGVWNRVDSIAASISSPSPPRSGSSVPVIRTRPAPQSPRDRGALADRARPLEPEPCLRRRPSRSTGWRNPWAGRTRPHEVLDRDPALQFDRAHSGAKFDVGGPASEEPIGGRGGYAVDGDAGTTSPALATRHE
jgi:hypothetical protein